MKKFLFVALIGGALVACNNASTTEGGVDTSSQAYKDSVAAANGSMMSTPPSDTGSMMNSMDTGMNKMMDTAGSKMKAMGDSMK